METTSFKVGDQVTWASGSGPVDAEITQVHKKKVTIKLLASSPAGAEGTVINVPVHELSH